MKMKNGNQAAAGPCKGQTHALHGVEHENGCYFQAYYYLD